MPGKGKVALMRESMKTVLASCLAVMLVTAEARADAVLDEAVAFNGTILHLQVEAPGLVLGAVKDGEISVVGFGETRQGNGVAPDGDTVLRIGSITKVFTGEMLAHAVARGEAGLADPVGGYLDGRLGQAVAEHPAIRLIDLATHGRRVAARGTPRRQPPDDPFATITPDAFAEWLETNPLLFTPGRSISYSNFGFDLLSAALSTAGNSPYADLLAERITSPLGMADTGFELNEGMADRLMTGHAPDGTPVPDVPTGEVITGSGGLRSTANDLLRWMQWAPGLR